MIFAGLCSGMTRLLRMLRTPYTRSLEDEIARLRIENRALLNSILGIAGMPPLPLETKIARERRRASTATTKAGTAALGGDVAAASSVKSASDARSTISAPQTPAGQGIALPVNAPTRRRSWQQINRILEIEESRRLANRDNSDAMRHGNGSSSLDLDGEAASPLL
jgi:hypothetical protein